jgi:hypothetical protein
MVMDGLSGIREPLPDVPVAERAGNARWPTRGRSKGTARRRTKDGKIGPITASDAESDAPEKEEVDLPSRKTQGEETPTDQELSAECYGADRTIAPTPPSKGRLIDIAI